MSSTKEFFKNNLVLVTGAALPLLLALFFWLATIIPAYMVEPPKYDLIFSTNTYYNGNFTFRVEEGKLKARYNLKANYPTNNQPILYRFEVTKGAVKTIDVPFPKTSGKDKKDDKEDNWQEVDIPAASKLTLDSSPTAPDGYTLSGYSYHGDGIMLGLFFGGGRGSRYPAIEKAGRKIKIPKQDNSYYGYNVQFLGWVTAEEKP